MCLYRCPNCEEIDYPYDDICGCSTNIVSVLCTTCASYMKDDGERLTKKDDNEKLTKKDVESTTPCEKSDPACDRCGSKESLRGNGRFFSCKKCTDFILSL